MKRFIITPLIYMILGMITFFPILSYPNVQVNALSPIRLVPYSVEREPIPGEILVVQESSYIIELSRSMTLSDHPNVQISVAPTKGLVSISGTKIIYTAGAISGTDQLSIHILDGESTYDVTFNFLINALPKVANNQFDNSDGTIYHGSLNATDSDGDAITYEVVSETTKGYILLDNETGTFTYVPDEDATGLDTWVVRLEDGKHSIDYTITMKLPLFQQNVISEVLFINSVILLVGFVLLFIILREQQIL